MDEPDRLLLAILELTGWTHARLVLELRRTALRLREPAPAGLNVVTVNRWKQGRQSPSGYYRRLIRHLHESTHRSAVSRDEVDPMKHRPSQSSGTSLPAPHRLGFDDRLADSLADVVHGHARLWYTVPPGALLSPTRGQLGVLNELRAVSRQGPAAPRLAGLTGHVAALAGWLSWLSGHRQGASAYYAFAHGLAGELRDDRTQAFVLVLRSFMCSDHFRSAKGGATRALALLDRAVELAGTEGPPHLRVFALARRAEEHAISRTSGAALAAGRDLDLAERALAGAPAPDPGFFGYLDRERLAGCRGTCAVVLGQPGEAVAVLTGVLTSTPGELAAERSILLTDLAAAYAQQAEVAQACDALSRSLALGAAGDANRIERILAVRHRYLSRWSDAPEVRRLDEQLREAVGPTPA